MSSYSLCKVLYPLPPVHSIAYSLLSAQVTSNHLLKQTKMMCWEKLLVIIIYTVHAKNIQVQMYKNSIIIIDSIV